MVKTRKNLSNRKIDKIIEKETLTATKPLSTLLSHQNKKSKDNQFYDELILSLADAHENKRARQVFEWESLRRRSL